MNDFKGLGLIEPLTRALDRDGYEKPTPIQAGAIPVLLKGRDLLGVAQTGTGKTAAFVLPMVQRLHEANAKPARKCPRALILAPTRELALQIHESVLSYARFIDIRSIVIFGGVPMPKQIKALNAGAQILVATPGRLLDLMNQDKVRLNKIETFVLDEADRMLDMGFVHDVKKVAAAVPEKRQTLLFSATMPGSVRSLADGLLTEPEYIEVTPQSTTQERVEQRVLFVPKNKKRTLLTGVMQDDAITKVLVFTRTKHSADRVARHLDKSGVRADAIHGNKTQSARQRALKAFSSGKLRALVATDIAARGIDVDGVSHVINFDLPNEPESYVHRIGRTARGGEDGQAISFCDAEERGYLRAIEKAIQQAVEVFADHPFHDEAMAEPEREPERRRGGGGPRRPKRAGHGAQNQQTKGKGHRPKDGKSHGDKGHGGHGHGKGGAADKNHGQKRTNAKPVAQKLAKKKAAKRKAKHSRGGPRAA